MIREGIEKVFSMSKRFFDAFEDCSLRDFAIQPASSTFPFHFHFELNFSKETFDLNVLFKIPTSGYEFGKVSWR